MGELGDFSNVTTVSTSTEPLTELKPTTTSAIRETRQVDSHTAG